MVKLAQTILVVCNNFFDPNAEDMVINQVEVVYTAKEYVDAAMQGGSLKAGDHFKCIVVCLLFGSIFGCGPKFCYAIGR